MLPLHHKNEKLSMGGTLLEYRRDLCADSSNLSKEKTPLTRGNG